MRSADSGMQLSSVYDLSAKIHIPAVQHHAGRSLADGMHMEIQACFIELLQYFGDLLRMEG